MSQFPLVFSEKLTLFCDKCTHLDHYDISNPEVVTVKSKIPYHYSKDGVEMDLYTWHMKIKCIGCSNNESICLSEMPPEDDVCVIQAKCPSCEHMNVYDISNDDDKYASVDSASNRNYTTESIIVRETLIREISMSCRNCDANLRNGCKLLFKSVSLKS